MNNAFVVFTLTLGLAGCSSDAPDPDGDWSMNLTFTSGTCPDTLASYPIEFTVSSNADGTFVFIPGSGLIGDSIGGTYDCAAPATSSDDAEQCSLSFMATGPDTLDATLILDSKGSVTGEGTSPEVDGGTVCMQSFTVDGNVTRL